MYAGTKSYSNNRKEETKPLEAGKKTLVTAMSISMGVEIISYGHGVLKGELQSRYLYKPFEFVNLVRMIEKMEEIFDNNGFPQRFLLPRTFGSAKREILKREAERYGFMNDATNPMSEEESGGRKCTFEITVRFRQNATWQGQIIWVEKNMRQNFRSVLEMLKLMDEALMDGAERIKPVEWQ